MSLSTILIYIILKRIIELEQRRGGLSTILIYIILKRHTGGGRRPGGLSTILIYIILKPPSVVTTGDPPLKYHTNLHHSQTSNLKSQFKMISSIEPNVLTLKHFMISIDFAAVCINYITVFPDFKRKILPFYQYNIQL